MDLFGSKLLREQHAMGESGSEDWGHRIIKLNFRTRYTTLVCTGGVRFDGLLPCGRYVDLSTR